MSAELFLRTLKDRERNDAVQTTQFMLLVLPLLKGQQINRAGDLTGLSPEEKMLYRLVCAVVVAYRGVPVGRSKSSTQFLTTASRSIRDSLSTTDKDTLESISSGDNYGSSMICRIYRLVIGHGLIVGDSAAPERRLSLPDPAGIHQPLHITHDDDTSDDAQTEYNLTFLYRELYLFIHTAMLAKVSAFGKPRSHYDLPPGVKKPLVQSVTVFLNGLDGFHEWDTIYEDVAMTEAALESLSLMDSEDENVLTMSGKEKEGAVAADEEREDRIGGDGELGQNVDRTLKRLSWAALYKEQCEVRFSTLSEKLIAGVISEIVNQQTKPSRPSKRRNQPAASRARPAVKKSTISVEDSQESGIGAPSARKDTRTTKISRNGAQDNSKSTGGKKRQSKRRSKRHSSSDEEMDEDQEEEEDDEGWEEAAVMAEDTQAVRRRSQRVTKSRTYTESYSDDEGVYDDSEDDFDPTKE